MIGALYLAIRDIALNFIARFNSTQLVHVFLYMYMQYYSNLFVYYCVCEVSLHVLYPAGSEHTILLWNSKSHTFIQNDIKL